MIYCAQKIKILKVKDIFPNPFHIRRVFYESELKSLADSIKKLGILYPIIVRRASVGYELICGQRRLRACGIAGIEEIPAIVIKAGDKECAQLCFADNVHRKELTLFEKADGIHNLLMYHKMKKEKISELLSVSVCDLHDYLRFLSLMPEVRQKAEYINAEKELVKILLRIKDDEKQLEILKKSDEGIVSLSEAGKLADEYIKENTADKSYCKNENLKISRTPLFENTVKKTVEILKKYGAKVEFSKIEEKNHTEYIIKTMK